MEEMTMNNLVRMGNIFPRVLNDFWHDDVFSKLMNENLPAANVSENETGFCVDLSVPGFGKNDIQVEIDKNILKVSAKVETEKEEKDKDQKVLRREFSMSSFARNFVLPDSIDVENISAKHEDGILKIMLPKKTLIVEDKVKTIKIG
jgi:HSP20 family protein